MGTKQSSPLDFFTGGKTAELAIAFNLAVDNSAKFIQQIQPGISDNPFNSMQLFTDETFARLREYMWIGHREDKNSAGYEVQQDDKNIISEALTLLVDLRNFHSHYWHHNNMMQLTEIMKNFIKLKHDTAVSKLDMEGHSSGLYNDGLIVYPLIRRDNGKII